MAVLACGFRTQADNRSSDGLFTFRHHHSRKGTGDPVVAFVPISPAAARELLNGVTANQNELLSDFVGAGLIKAYARVVETLSANGGRAEVRDAQLKRDMWKRVVAEGKLERLLATSSVTLEGDAFVGGRPSVIITGVRFNEANVRDVAAQHCGAPSAVKTPEAHEKPKAVIPAATPTAPNPPSRIEIPDAASCANRKVRAGLPNDAVTVSIKDAMDILDVSRGTIGNLIKRGTLESRKVGARTLIVADSIRAILAS